MTSSYLMLQTGGFPQKKTFPSFFLHCLKNKMTQQSSPMSITQLVHSSEQDNVIVTTNDIEDPDVKIAAEVLGDMARLSNIKKGSVQDVDQNYASH